MEIIEKTRNLLRETKDFILGSPWRGELMSTIDAMLNDVDKECDLAVFGTVKAGKSTFINTLLGEDLAVVNVTEATATINYFKYAKDPKHHNKVFVVYSDGHTEWRDKEFLDSLQGNTPEVLERSKDIDHLEIYILNDILRTITIVDTPGTHSVVDEHSKQTENYSAHAERNVRESVRLKDKADAVILLIGHVKGQKDSENVKKFADANNPYNSIGIISKIDIEEDDTIQRWRDKCESQALEYQDHLHSIHPVSSGIYRTVKELDQTGRLSDLQCIIKRLDEPELFYEVVLTGIDAKLDEKNRPVEPLEAVRFGSDECEYEALGFGYEQRYNILKLLPVPTIRHRILKELYENDYEKAIANLLDYSGFDKIRTILDSQFFSRSYAIRCHTILKKLKDILNDLKTRRISEIEEFSRNRSNYLKVIKQFNGQLGQYKEETTRIIDSFQKLIDRHTLTSKQVEELTNQLELLFDQTQNYLDQMEGLNHISEGLLILENNRGLFTEEEIKELELLFGKYPDKVFLLDQDYSVGRRFNFWKNRADCATHKDIQRISELARDAWSRK